MSSGNKLSLEGNVFVEQSSIDLLSSSEHGLNTR